MLGGVRQILIVNESSITGHDPLNGKALWEHAFEGSSKGVRTIRKSFRLAATACSSRKDIPAGRSCSTSPTTTRELERRQNIWMKTNILKTKFTNVAVFQGFVYGLSDGILECADTRHRQAALETRPLRPRPDLPCRRSAARRIGARAKSRWSKPRLTASTNSAASRPLKAKPGTRSASGAGICWSAIPNKPPARICRWRGRGIRTTREITSVFRSALLALRSECRRPQLRIRPAR